MRYIITSSQIHQVVYKYLDKMFQGYNDEKKQNPSNKNAFRMTLKSSNGDEKIEYFYFGPGEYDDDTKHFGIGNLHIHPNIVDELRQIIKIRETKVVDIIADWFSEKFDLDVDNIGIYPERKTPAVY
jgi:hypothetical protein